ncbi:jg3428 [Pararge aegeria aegeria]|uniref:Jg3428 protein n=1 Tax=Pararge aegeria aegeria TaxID=348720 RepID=A0A8S4RQX1_9NEOP|nr:jg3428 [Pararge aegeria aegeria]
MINICHENLTALKSLDLPVQQWSFPLLNSLLRKITPSIRRRFELSLKSSSEIPLVSEFLDFLEKELAALEVMSAAQHSARLANMSGTSRQPTSVTRSGASSAYADSSTQPTNATRPSFSRAPFDTKINNSTHITRPTRNVSFHSSASNK